MTKPLIYTILAAILLAGGVWWGVTYFNNTNTSVQNANGQVVANMNTVPVVETTGWKTYRNTKYEYEFKYPHWWELADSMDSNVIDPVASSISFSEFNPYHSNDFSVDTPTPTQCSAITECVEERLPTTAGQSYAPDDGLQPIIIDGVEGLQIKRNRLDSGRWHYRYAYLLKGSVLYILSSSTDPDLTGVNDAIVEEIFKSFKFLK